MIEAKLSCQCGAIQGKVCAKREDSMRLYCYCNDCRGFTNAIAAIKHGAKNSKPKVDSSGACRLVLVSKNAVTIDQGKENMKLARKSADEGGMFRYYAGCCNVPLMNTADSIGFVGVYDDILDEKKTDEFDGPLGRVEHEATKLPIIDPIPTMSDARFMEIVKQHAPWTKSGPFDYSLTPIYWGE
jgi:hypothetical protein